MFQDFKRLKRKLLPKKTLIANLRSHIKSTFNYIQPNDPFESFKKKSGILAIACDFFT